MTSSQGSSLVIDAGIGFALCVEPGSSNLRRALAAAVENGTSVYAPTLWHFEVTSIFTKAVHFQQMNESMARQAMQLMGEMQIELVHPDPELTIQAFNWTRRLNRAAAYDSFYLALAQRLGADLWTMDKRLVNGVNEAWVHYMGKLESE